MSVSKSSFILLLVWCAILPASHATMSNTAQLSPQQNSYAKNLLKAALKTNYTEHHVSASPAMNNLYGLDASAVDIVWLPESSIDKNTNHHVVKIPVFRGLLSYYSVIYHKPSIMNVARQGFKDSEIGMLHSDNVATSLQESGVKVVKTRAVQSLVHMLNKARFDAIVTPVSRVTDLSVTDTYQTPQHIAVLYNPYYFVIHKDKPQLAEALEQGLHQMLQNGVLDSMMENTPWMQETQNHLAQYKIVPLNLTGATSFDPENDVNVDFWVHKKPGTDLPKPLLAASN